MSRTLANGIEVEKSLGILESLPYKKGRYASRNWGHRFHFLLSYPSKLKPSIAYFLVQLFTKEDERVLDPFSGVGVIPFEACRQGRIGIGSDLSPVAYHATKAKVDPPTVEEIERQLRLLQRFVEENKSRVEMDVEEEIVPYYHSQTLKEILAAKKFFETNQEENLSFLIACVLHILHGNRPYALSRRSHNIMPWPPKGPTVYKSLFKSLYEKVQRMLKPGLPLTFVRGKALQDNVFKLSLGEETVDSIITSPPFYSNRDFLRMNRIRLWFCGWRYEMQNEMKSVFLEHQKDIGIYDGVFGEFYRVLKPDSLCIMHLGVVKTVDMANRLAPHAEKHGFEKLRTIYEDTSKLESHGIVDRGATQEHQFLILKK